MELDLLRFRPQTQSAWPQYGSNSIWQAVNEAQFCCTFEPTLRLQDGHSSGCDKEGQERGIGPFGCHLKRLLELR